MSADTPALDLSAEEPKGQRRPSREDWAVYALTDPDGAVRYVGVTHDPTDRIKRHSREGRYLRTHRGAWVRALADRGEAPVMRVLEWTTDWDEAERRWIAHFRAAGADLVNGNDGGRDMRQARDRLPKIPTLRAILRILERDAREAACANDIRRQAKFEAAHAAVRGAIAAARSAGALADLEGAWAKRFG